MVDIDTLERHDVTAADGTRLRVYEVPGESDGADGVNGTDGDEAVLCLHGGLTSARALFAPPVGDTTSHSWLHAIAERGRTAYALDIRGYGESEMLPEYDEPADANDPPVRAWDAADDVAAAVDFVMDRHDTAHLLGVSWGTMTGGSFLEQYDREPASFVQCAPVYKSPVEFEAAAEALGLTTDIGTYIVEEYNVVKQRQGGGEVFETVWSTNVDSGQGLDDENAYIAQTGALADTRDCCAGSPPYDATEIDLPTLVIRGSEDHTSQRGDALALYDELAGARTEYAEIRGGDHFVMHGSRRVDLYDAVDAFQNRVSRTR